MPSSPQRHMTVLMRFAELAQQKNAAAIDALETTLFHPDFTYVVGGRGRISGLYRGWKEYRTIVADEVATPADLQAVTTDDDRVVLLTRLTGEREGRFLDQQVCFVFRFADGKLVEGRSIPTDDYTWDEFWA